MRKAPLGSYDEMEAKGVKNAGTPNLGGSIATAGGPARFRSIDPTKSEGADSLIAFALP